MCEKYYKVDRLLKDELVYELKTRKGDTSGTETVDDLRKNLRKSLNDNKKVYTVTANSQESAERELDTIRVGLGAVGKAVNSTSFDKSLLETIVTRFTHYQFRLGNLVFQEDAKLQSTRDDLRTYCLNLENKIGEILNQVESKTGNTSTVIEPQNSGNQTVTMGDNIKTPRVEPTTFEGRGADVEEFLEEYNLAASLNNWTNEIKYKFLPYYLRGQAKTVFQNNKGEVQDWNQCEELLKRNFNSTGKKESLHWEMYNRGQEPSETATEYVENKIKLMIKANVQMAEEEKAKLILFGLRPEIAARVSCMTGNSTIAGLKENINVIDFANYVTDRSVKRIRDNTLSESPSKPQWADELIRAVSGLKMQENSQQGSQYREQNFNDRRPNNYYRSSNNSNNRVNRQGYGPRRSITPDRSKYQRDRSQHREFVRTSSGRLRTCFKCNKPGHLARDCWSNQKNGERPPGGRNS